MNAILHLLIVCGEMTWKPTSNSFLCSLRRFSMAFWWSFCVAIRSTFLSCITFISIWKKKNVIHSNLVSSKPFFLILGVFTCYLCDFSTTSGILYTPSCPRLKYSLLVIHVCHRKLYTRTSWMRLCTSFHKTALHGDTLYVIQDCPGTLCIVLHRL